MTPERIKELRKTEDSIYCQGVRECLDEIDRLNKELGDLAAGNLEAQHRAATENSNLRALNKEMVEVLREMHPPRPELSCRVCDVIRRAEGGA